MDAGPLTSPAAGRGPAPGVAPPPSWALSRAVGAQTQAYVVTGFVALPTGRALLLNFAWQDGPQPAGFVQRLLAAAPITPAIKPDVTGASAQDRAATIAFSGTGLRKLGFTDVGLASFSRAFREGMFQEDRMRRLGDRRLGAWQATVIDDGPVWSANTPLRAATPSLPGAFDVPPAGPGEDHIETAVTVHALLLLYTLTEADAEAWAGSVSAAIAADGATIVRTLDLVLDIEHQGFSREHFGFADALSQPLPYDARVPEGADSARSAVLVGTAAAAKDPVQGVPLGEFLIGHIDGHHEKAPGPVVPDDAVSKGALLLPSDQAEGFCDFGANGSYLVARELKQDVAAFWRSMEDNAAAMRAADPANGGHITAAWLAERVIGRDKDGHLLCPGNAVLPACSNDFPDSSFLFRDRDPRGEGCPAGSHVRRAFPRDALAPDAASEQTLLNAANNHRILRRGRKFGTKLADPGMDDGADRGLLFMCLNTDIDRQFEFVQQTWLLNSAFATLFDEVDPLVGPAGNMTIRGGGLRRTAHVDTFVRLAGGDYFFLPSMPALTYLSSR